MTEKERRRRGDLRKALTGQQTCRSGPRISACARFHQLDESDLHRAAGRVTVCLTSAPQASTSHSLSAPLTFQLRDALQSHRYQPRLRVPFWLCVASPSNKDQCSLNAIHQPSCRESSGLSKCQSVTAQDRSGKDMKHLHEKAGVNDVGIKQGSWRADEGESQHPEASLLPLQRHTLPLTSDLSPFTLTAA
ncbi:unnamed protein product [Pleuronectes platessa]|uniref:Uncharacterized protein n=1 Tax=Pleuronectes platessa TaxID=8262 RepID=A0A9N7YD09_PLEPL|nr:unnamed protein product [Pleuronectes platessa]